MKAVQSVKQMQRGHPLCPGFPWHSTALVFPLIRICFGAGTSGGDAQKQLLELLELLHGLRGLWGDQLS